MKLNKTYCNLVNFGSCFIIHSLGMGLFLFILGPALVCRMDQFSNSVAAHSRTNEVEVIPWGCVQSAENHSLQEKRVPLILVTAIFILVVSSVVFLNDVLVTCRWGSPSFLLAEFCCCRSKNRTRDRATVRLCQR